MPIITVGVLAAVVRAATAHALGAPPAAFWRGLDRDVCARADGDAEVGLGEGEASLPPSPTMATLRPPRWSSAHLEPGMVDCKAGRRDATPARPG
ncbi:hypothetical protein ACWGI8_18360 [Streptomyces sp. NPDC054841]